VNSTRNPARGEIWRVNFDPVRGHEQGGQRPALVISVDPFNQGPADLVIVAPITSVPKGIPSHIWVNPPEGGLVRPSFIKCEDIRSISKQRLSTCLGRIQPATMNAVERCLVFLLGL